MDPRTEWGLNEFRDASIELRLLDHGSISGAGAADAGASGHNTTNTKQQPLDGGVAGAATAGGRRRALPIRSAFQGERLAGLLVVKFDASAGGEERRSRWRNFGSELDVELEITTEAVASASTAFVPEEPSLWRDYEGRENARDRGVLARSNRTVGLRPDSTPANERQSEELVYAIDVDVQVPVDFLGQKVVLEALISPAQGGLREGGDTPGANASGLSSRYIASASSSAAGEGGHGGHGCGSDGGGGGSNSSGGGAGGRRRGVGGDFANRLDNLFALSRVAPVRLPVRRCFLPLRVVQPITVTSRSCPSSSSSSYASAPAAPTSCSAPYGAIGCCLVALEVRNDHPVAGVTVHDVEIHVDATARCGDKASWRGFSAPGKAGAGAGRGWGGVGKGSGRRRMSGGVPKGGASPPLEGLDGSIEQPPLSGGGGLGGSGAPPAGSFSRVFCASWVVKPVLPLHLAPGEVQSFVLSIRPAGETLPPRRAGGRFESPVTFVWTLEAGGGNGADGGTVVVGGTTAKAASRGAAPAAARDPLASPSSRRSSSRPRSPSPPPALGPAPSARVARRLQLLPVPPPTTTSVHLAQWQSEERTRDEVLVMVKGRPRVKLNRVFEVLLRVRNLADSPRDLVVMFTEDPAEGHRGRGGADGGGGHQNLSLDGSGGGALSVGSDTDGDDDGDPIKDISPSASPTHHGRTVSFTIGTNAGFGGTGGADGQNRSRYRIPPPPGTSATASSAAPAAALAPTSLHGDLLPVDAAVPLGRLERGAEHSATVRLTAARAGLARLSSLCLWDSLTGSLYVPAHPYEVFVES